MRWKPEVEQHLSVVPTHKIEQDFFITNRTRQVDDLFANVNLQILDAVSEDKSDLYLKTGKVSLLISHLVKSYCQK